MQGGSHGARRPGGLPGADALAARPRARPPALRGRAAAICKSGLVVAIGFGLATLAGCTRTQVVVTGADGGGSCTDAGCDCPVGLVECAGACVDTQVDWEHCGRCDGACGIVEECREGICTCLAGAERCGGDLCRDLQRDPNHCGGCDDACEGAEVCLAGGCDCRAGLTRCGDDCVDTDSSAEHCGSCEHRCSEDPGGEYCFDGVCTAVACDQRDPSTEGCGAAERDCVPPAELAWSPLHCGECDERCDAEEVCTQGMCQAFFAPVACEACPCSECGQNLCCAYPGTTLPVCVVGAQTCPPGF